MINDMAMLASAAVFIILPVLAFIIVIMAIMWIIERSVVDALVNYDKKIKAAREARQIHSDNLLVAIVDTIRQQNDYLKTIIAHLEYQSKGIKSISEHTKPNNPIKLDSSTNQPHPSDMSHPSHPSHSSH